MGGGAECRMQNAKCKMKIEKCEESRRGGTGMRNNMELRCTYAGKVRPGQGAVVRLVRPAKGGKNSQLVHQLIDLPEEPHPHTACFPLSVNGEGASQREGGEVVSLPLSPAISAGRVLLWNRMNLLIH